MHERIGAMCVVGALLMACGGGGGGDAGTVGCNVAARGMCTENYRAAEGYEIDWQGTKQGCMETGGAWESCPTAGRAGTCTVDFGAFNFDVVFYAGLVCSPAEGEELCSSMEEDFIRASFTPGPAGCGAPSDNTLACDQTTSSSRCVLLSGSMEPERVGLLEKECSTAGGTLGTDCSIEGLLATCAGTAMGGLEVTESYYPGADLLTAQADCVDLGGTWTENP